MKGVGCVAPASMERPLNERPFVVCTQSDWKAQVTFPQRLAVIRLARMDYRPVILADRTNDCVRAVVARKLDGTALRLLITPDGNISPEQHRDRQHTTTR